MWQFVMADENSDGLLSKKEILNVLTRYLLAKKRRLQSRGFLTIEEKRVIKAKGDEFFEAADRNHNGVIEIEEFMHAWNKFRSSLERL